MNIGFSAAIFGEFLLLLFLWIGGWTLVTMFIDEYVKSFRRRVLIYLLMFVISGILILTLGDQFVFFQ